MPYRGRVDPKIKMYWQKLSRAKYPFYCRECRDEFVPCESMKASQLVDHVERVHGRSKKSYCPWCYEPFRIEGVGKNGAHLLECFVKHHKKLEVRPFRVVDTNNVPPASDCPSPSTSCGYLYFNNVIHTNYDPCRWNCRRFRSEPFWTNGVSRVEGIADFYRPCPFTSDDRHVEDVLNSRDSAIAPESPNRLVLRNTLTFSIESGLGEDAVHYLKSYFRTRDAGMAWIHLMVKAFAFPSFARAMQKISDCAASLPYWCVCSGKSRSNLPIDHVHHRHMILATNDFDRFKRAWDEINGDRIVAREQCKKYYLVKDEYHFVNLISYVSHESSSCRAFYKKREEIDPCLRLETKEDDGHYFVHRKTFVHSRLALHLLLPNGIQKYFKSVLGRRRVWPWMESLQKTGLDWTVPIGEAHGRFTCTLPLKEGWLPDPTSIVSVESLMEREDGIDDPERPFLFVSDREVMLMKRTRLCTPSSGAWEGDVDFERFWEKLSEGRYVLCPGQQEKARELKEYADACNVVWLERTATIQRDFEVKMETLRDELQKSKEREIENREKCLRLQETNERNERKLEEYRMQISVLKDSNEMERKYWMD